MATISKLKVGQVLYTVTRSQAGNTTLRTVHVHEVVVLEIGEDGRFVMASWNHNPVRKYWPNEIDGWKVSKPITVPSVFGTKRLATKAEKAEILAKQNGTTATRSGL